MTARLLLVAIALAAPAARVEAAGRDYPLRTAGVTDVRLTRGFWFDRFETNRITTVADVWRKCGETSRLSNFQNAAQRKVGTFGGIPFDDSDVYKVLEGTAYTLAQHSDDALFEKAKALIGNIAAAQEPDGYLYTARTLGFDVQSALGGKGFGMMGPTRWSNLPYSHELYNVGHLYEAAVAWFDATGRRDLLEVAVKSADLVDRTFGPEPTQLKGVSGHEEIELALVKLYRATGEERYLRLAKHFVDSRGAAAAAEGCVFAQDGTLISGVPSGKGSYRQDHLPVFAQREAVGHAVRAGYFYCAIVDMAALTGDERYRETSNALWNNVVSRKMHLTGGIGARPKGEEFGADYELPNDKGVTYLETCAAIANALWNERMFRLTGDSRYVDVLERIIYNGFASGISLSGSEYFYPNPLASKGGYCRSKWFRCSCCPVNDVRFVPQIPSFAYATDGTNVYWNLFMEGEAKIAGRKLSVKTSYPWCGTAEMSVTPARDGEEFALLVRIPGWADGRPVPSDLYAQVSPSDAAGVGISVNGEAVRGIPGQDGYVRISRRWNAGDRVSVGFPMPVKRIRAHHLVKADEGRLAVERGPIVYCAEGIDNDGKAYGAVLPGDATFAVEELKVGDSEVSALRASNGLVLVPYCVWGNRAPGGEMQVWFRESQENN